MRLPNGKEVRLDTNAFSAFFSRYERKYTVEEQDRITSIADQLIEEAARRFSGDFWTPTVWANRSHEVIADVVGENWNRDYVVWDMACGTKNLTRDLQFNELYSSTIHQEELDMSTQYNPEGDHFQYDFLNDDINISPKSNPFTLKMPRELFEKLINDEPIIFYTNPPYGTANDAGARGTSKQSIALTKTNELMRAERIGQASQQLYAQFFYRVIKLKRDFNLSNVYIAFFSKPQFLVGGRYWKSFNDLLFKQFSFEKGILFNAGEFSDVSDKWAVNFSIFKVRDQLVDRYEKIFNFSVEYLTPNGINKIKDKQLEIVEEIDSLSNWLREPLRNNKTEKKRPYPQFSSAFNVNEGRGHRGRLTVDAFGYMVTLSNNVFQSQRDVFIFSGAAYKGNGVSVTPDSFERVVVTFATRKSITHTWINDMDNFKQPNQSRVGKEEWDEFVNDCMIYSLFNIGASYQTSLKNVSYHGELYDIKNEWFFMSYEDIKQLAQKYYLNEIEEDLRFVKNERFVYNKIKQANLSNEAQAVYDEVVELYHKSFETRDLANQEHPEWGVKNWDAGFYQIYKLIDEYKLDDLISFRENFKNLELKIEQFVYRLGMLNP